MDEGSILLRLKRKYSRDEEIALLIKRMKEVEFENGVLKSDLSEKVDQLKSAKHQLELCEAKKNDYLNRLNKASSKFNAKFSKLNKEIRREEIYQKAILQIESLKEYKSKYLSLLAKQNTNK